MKVKEFLETLDVGGKKGMMVNIAAKGPGNLLSMEVTSCWPMSSPWPGISVCAKTPAPKTVTTTRKRTAKGEDT